MNKHLVDYPEWNETVKRVIEEYGEKLVNEYDFEGIGELTEVSHAYSPGFWPSQNGGWEYIYYTLASHLTGGGYEFSNEEANEELYGSYVYCLESAIEWLMEEYEEELRGIPEDKINYEGLFEIGMGELAEILDEKHIDYMDIEPYKLELRCYYIDKDKEFLVESLIGWGTHYGYSDFANEVFENVSFTAIEGEDIEPKLREALDKVMEIF